MVPADALLTSHCGTRTWSRACHTVPPPPDRVEDPQAPSSLPRLLSSHCSHCSESANTGCCSWRDPEERARRVPGQEVASPALKISESNHTTQKWLLRRPSDPPRTPRSKAFRLFKVRELPLIEHNDTCKAYGSKIHTTQPKFR